MTAKRPRTATREFRFRVRRRTSRVSSRVRILDEFDREGSFRGGRILLLTSQQLTFQVGKTNSREKRTNNY
jgi:hypothetical protein